MELPEKIRVGALDYKIIRDPFLSRNRNEMGHFSACALELKVDSSIEEARQIQTFFHELMEAANFEYALDISHQQIELLELMLMQVLRDNPWVGRLTDGV